MNRSVHCISAGSRVRLLIYLLVHHLRMHTWERYKRMRSPVRRWTGRSMVYRPLSRSKPEHREGKLILPWREDEAFRLRALANNRASSRSSWVTVGIRSIDPLCRFLDRVKASFPAGFVESAIVTADRKRERDTGSQPACWFIMLVTNVYYWIRIDLCASANQARNRILLFVPCAFPPSHPPPRVTRDRARR